MSKITRFLILLFLIFDFASAAKGPEYRSLRVHGMGGAFVALADGREALYYNPAGLNLKGRFENFEKYPEMGYMPGQRYELRLLTLSIGLPGNEIRDVLNICGAPQLASIVKNFLFFNYGYFHDKDRWCPDYADVLNDNEDDWQTVLANNPQLEKRMRVIDHSLIEVGTQISILEFSMHNFGFAAWINAAAAPYPDLLLVVPGFGYEPTKIDAVVQTAFAFSPIDDWSFGMGLKAARRHKTAKFDYLPELDLGSLNNPEVDTDRLDSLKDFWSSYAGDSLARFDFDDIKFALDFGILYQLTREVRLGTSLRNVFFSELAGESITPNWSIGAAYSPMVLQSNSWWARKVNFAMDYTDMLDGTVGSMFFSHWNFGAEVEQVVLPSPTRDFSFWPRFGFGILGGLLGAGTGYLIGKNFDSPYTITSVSLGSLIGLNIGFGGDALRTSVGAGFEGGYSAWNVGLGVSDAVALRFGSYVEERGFKTGQKQQRFWTGELSVGF